MRLELLQAVALVGALYAAGPMAEPPALAAHQLAGHLGQRVALTGRVADVEPGDEVHRVTLEGREGTATVLTRGEVPALGATVRAVGDAAADRGRAVLWVDDWRIDHAPDRAPVGVERAVRQAPERAGTAVAVVGTWDAERGRLVDEQAGLPVRLRAQPPPGDAPIVAWGQLAYAPDRAAYELRAVGWERWTGSPG